MESVVHEAVPEDIVVLKDIIYTLIRKEVFEWYEGLEI